MGSRLKYIEFANELKRHLSGSEYRSMKIEKAFIKWYVFAKYGISDGAVIVDGARDGGIDAIFQVEGVFYVIQSKYEVKPRLSKVQRNELGAFERVASLLSDKQSQTDFEQWLKTVREELHTRYKALRKIAQKDDSNVRYIFITTKQLSLEPGEKVEVEDIQHITALWDLHSRGFTPPVENIVISINHEWEIPIGDGFKTHVGLAETDDFLELMRDDKNERLFAQNVRTDLRSQINKGIRKTYEDDPGRFWLFNNGLYIVCSKLDHLGSNKLRLKYPSIINGSQTLHSIKHAKSHKPSKVLVRILVMDTAANPSLLSDVIRRTNTQNPMKLINLSAQDPFQLNIARYLDRHHIFYERREKEWVNEKKNLLPDYYHINVKEVTQWLSVLHRDIGFGLARTRVADLFQPTHYEKIFTNFDTHYSSPDYSRLALIIWSGVFTQGLIGHLTRKTKPFGKISQLLLIKATYDALLQNKDLQNTVTNMLSNHQFGNENIPSAILRWYVDAIKSFIGLQRNAQKKDPQLDFSNYFKRNNLTELAFSKVCNQTAVKKLSKLLVTKIKSIE